MRSLSIAFITTLIATFGFAAPALALTFTRPLVQGSTGPDVTSLQQLLKTQGYFSGDVTGYFGPQTGAAVATFQTAHGIDPLGGVGPQTRNILNTLSGPTPAAATDNAALIAALLAEIKVLRAKIAAILAARAAGTGGGAAYATITHQLALGSTGADVTTLQQFLVSKGLLTLPTGSTGSPQATGYYGPATAAAVSAYQSANNLEPVGSVGPKTLASINSAITAANAALAANNNPPASSGQANTTGVVQAAGTPTTISNYIPLGGGGGGGGGGNSNPAPSSGGGAGSSSGSGSSGGGGGGSSGTPADTAAPSVPGSVIATAQSTTSVSITWSASTDDVGVAGYFVLRNGVQIATPSSTSYTDNGLSPNTQYSYTVEAVDAAGNTSAPSAAITVTTQSASLLDITPPVITAPTPHRHSCSRHYANDTCRCHRRSGNLRIRDRFYHAICFDDAVYLDRRHNAHESAFWPHQWGSYTYLVKCQDTSRNISNNATVSFSVATPASPVVTLSASATTVVSGNSSTLTWSSTNATSCAASAGWSGSKTTSGSQTLTNLTTTATYALTCTGAGGSANQSATITVTPAPDTTAPSIPTGLTAIAISPTALNLSWTASTDNVGVSGYQVFRNGTRIGTPITNSYSDTGLTASTQYSYTIKAKDAAGNVSAPSTVTNVTTPAPPDTTPPAVTISAPTVNLPAGTTQTSLSVTTNENAACRYSTNSAFTFSTGTLFTATGALSHTTTVTGLTDNTSYTYYVKCSDTAGNVSGNASVTFSVAAPADTTSPSIPTSLIAAAVSSSQINLSWTASTDNVGATGYNVFRGGIQVATSLTNSYSDTGLRASTQYSYTVKAFDAAGKSLCSINSCECDDAGCEYWGGALPTGVTLQAIDGETMIDSTTMSHNFYSSNGLTYATNNPSYPGKSWDELAFFPVENFYGLYGLTQSDFTTFNDLGLNVSSAVTGNSDYSLFAPNSVQGIGGWNGSTIENTAGNWMVGMHVDESDPTTPIATISNSIQDHRLWDLTGTWNDIVAGDISGVAMSTVLNKTYPTPNGTSRKIDNFSTDVYWFAGSTDSAIQPQGGAILAQPMSYSAPSATADQMARGSNYGNMIDVFRSYANNTNSGNGSSMVGTSGKAGRIPLVSIVEETNGWLSESSARNITPPELNWAVWSSLIHGARGIDYFTDYREFSTTISSGQTISAYNQAKATNALIKQLAPVLNSPFAVNYVTASPHGYNFPTPEGNWLNNGIETMAKYYNGTYYVFADTRDSESITNIPATFTIKNTGAASIAVIGENRTLPVTNGTTFTDTFANGNTVHIYQVGAGGSATDTSAPSTPTGLTATTISSSQINLTWTVSTDNVSVSGYQVFRNGAQIGIATTNSYSDTGLNASTAYTYTVRAIDAAGNVSAASNTASATTQAAASDTTPPSVIIGAPSGQLAPNTTQTTLTVATNESATCAWSNTAGNAFGSMTIFTTTGGTAHSTALTGLTNGTSYTTYVKCKDTVGNVSTDSSTQYSVATPGAMTITMGETTNLGATDSGNGNLLIVQDATLSQQATIQSLSFYVTSAAGNLRLGIYDATGPGGGPGALKAQTNSFTPVVGWNTQVVITPISLPAGSYWLAYFPSDNSLQFSANYGIGAFKTTTLTFGAMPASFPTATQNGVTHWSLYATLSVP